jgi:hypothetical protein
MAQTLALLAWVIALAGCGRSRFDAADPDAAPPDGVDAPAAPGPIVHLTFDTGRFLLDELGHHPTCTGCPTQVGGHLGQAASFDGSASCLTIPDTPALRPSAFTIALWQLAPSTQTVDGFVVSRSLGGATDVSNTIAFTIDPADEWYFEVTGQATTRTIAHGVWHHFAGVYDGSRLAMFVDGNQLDPAIPAPLTYGADNLRIGCDFDIGSEVGVYAGLVDDFRFYDLALAAGEIAALASM